MIDKKNRFCKIAPKFRPLNQTTVKASAIHGLYKFRNCVMLLVTPPG